MKITVGLYGDVRALVSMVTNHKNSAVLGVVSTVTMHFPEFQISEFHNSLLKNLDCVFQISEFPSFLNYQLTFLELSQVLKLRIAEEGGYHIILIFRKAKIKKVKWPHLYTQSVAYLWCTTHFLHVYVLYTTTMHVRDCMSHSDREVVIAGATFTIE